MDDSPSNRVTPRTLIRGIIASKKFVNKSALKPPGKSQKKNVSVTSAKPETVSSSTKGTKRKSASWSESTPRTLIQGFLKSHDTVAPQTRKRGRTMPSPAISKPPPSSSKSSTRKKALLNRMRMAETPGNPTPRTAIRNFLMHAAEETPVVAPAHGDESTVIKSSAVSADRSRASSGSKQDISRLKIPTPASSPRRSQRNVSRNRKNQMSMDAFAAGVQELRQGDNSVFAYNDASVSSLASVQEEGVEEEELRDNMGADHQTRDLITDIDESQEEQGNQSEKDGVVTEVDNETIEEEEDNTAGTDNRIEKADDTAEESGNAADGEESGSDARHQLTATGDNSVFQKKQERSMVQATIDMFSALKTPVVQPQQSTHTPPPLSKTLTPKKLQAQKQTPVKKAKKSAPKDKSQERLPSSLTKSIFTHFSKNKVTKAAMVEVENAADSFWKNMCSDLAAYSNHRHSAITIDESDVQLLMRRQRFISNHQSMYTLVEKYLPLEYRQEIIPVARSGNKVEPRK